ncbi:hypothetical protein WR25_12953 [Diploscapter pachys]|uniref:N-acetyltransferase domain-containing protein n=1 Tax=Diploscapter pachys TaxID=2018661 RepID=A0A2A2K356_9BILA|nr:hypothetical protein WR25_12953 [Diploscapter pachys]
MEERSSRYSIVKLFDRQDRLWDSVKLLNEEWPRSDGSREHSQKKSCRPSPPMSFLLLETESDKLIGHTRACLLPNRPTACWIESVLIRKDHRGKGLGKFLMTEVEKWLRANGFDESYLSTDDQVEFYQHCGYEKCAPILHSTVSTSVFPICALLQENPSPEETSKKQDISSSEKSAAVLHVNGISIPLAPPPPPAPPTQKKSSNSSIGNVDHQFMKKRF